MGWLPAGIVYPISKGFALWAHFGRLLAQFQYGFPIREPWPARV